MCELLGVSGAIPISLGKELRLFFSHSKEHPHGWGLYLENGILYHAANRASEDAHLQELLRRLEPQRNLLAHIRFATIGSLSDCNCHPFLQEDSMGRKWILAHNGTIFSGLSLLPYLKQQKGETDSERISLYLLDRVNEAIAKKGGNLTREERFSVVAEMVRMLSPRNKLNLMVFDGECLYVHKNMKHTLYYQQKNHAMVFATAPINEGKWQDFPLCQLCSFVQGQLVGMAPRHEFEYIACTTNLPEGIVFAI